MYEAFFGMNHTPFVRDVPPQKLYESKAFLETLGRLFYVADRQMFAVVTADSGCGKSTLIRRFCFELPKEDYIVLYLSDSKLTPRWFYKGMLDQLGLEARFYRGDSKRQLQQEIEIIRGVQKKKVVCILDEAHLLEKETLEEFRFLLNYKFDSMSPMALVLVGQSELWDNKLRLKQYTAIRQRIDMCCTLSTFDQSQTERYIASHMNYSECTHEIFTSKALEEIHKATGGVARMINRVCEKSLMYAFQNQKRLIDDYMIKFVVEHEMIGLSNS